jgi:DNA-binding transcriptional regulator YiaG
MQHFPKVSTLGVVMNQSPTVAEAMELANVRQLIVSGRAQSIREAARLTRSEVGSAIGVTGAAVALWENQGRMPRGDNALAYGRLLASLADLHQGGAAA